MKLLMLVWLMASSCLAQESLDLEFEESGKKYTERIVIDYEANTTIYEVPKHAKLEQSAYLIDRNNSLEVIKIMSLMKCFVRKLPTNEPSNKDLKETFQKIGFKFPHNKYMFENHDFVAVGKLEKSEVPINVQKFCSNYEIYKVKDITNIKQLEKDATNFLTKARSKRSSGNQKLEFVFCKERTSYGPIRCQPGQTAKAKCQFQLKSCVYNALCDTYDLAVMTCKGAPTHILNSNFCCNVVCV